MEEIKFTHYWVTGKGWEVTVLQPEDFVEVEEMGHNPEDGVLFFAENEKNGHQIFKGKYERLSY